MITDSAQLEKGMQRHAIFHHSDAVRVSLAGTLVNGRTGSAQLDDIDDYDEDVTTGPESCLQSETAQCASYYIFSGGL